MSNTTALNSLNLDPSASIVQSQVNGLAGNLALGIPVTYKTSGQISGYTPALSEVVYTTDTGHFYIGDGSSSGGSAFAPPLDQAALRRLEIIVPRHRFIGPWLAGARASANVSPGLGFCIGNSI